MTHKRLCTSVLLVGAMMIAGTMAGEAQTKPSVDVAVTYTAERAKIEPSNCGCFWLSGGSGDAGINVYKGLGAAFNVIGQYANNIAPGVSLDEIEYMGGLRYTRRVLKKPGVRVFVEGLAGAVHAFNGLFPENTRYISQVNKLAVQAGGGVDLALTHHFGVRVEGDWVRTDLPNGATNSQNNLRLAGGLSYHFGK